MAHNHFLLLYIILVVLSSLDSHFIDGSLTESLLKTPYQKLAHLDDEESHIYVPPESLTDLQVRRPNPTRSSIKSMIKTTTGRVTHFFTTQTSESPVLTSWEVCYDISKKVSQSSRSPNVNRLAAAVLKLGPRLVVHQDDTDQIEHLRRTIDLFYLFLEEDFMNTAERLWSVGVLSYLRPQSLGYRNFPIPSFWTAKDIYRPRGDFLIFLFKDKDLGRVIRDSSSESPSELETSEQVVQEAVRRDEIVHLIQTQMAHRNPSRDFQNIYLAFTNLKTPIDSEKASLLMKSIGNSLTRPKSLKENGFDEEANIIRLLLHLEEYHYQSYAQFTELINKPEIRKKILVNDINFQLSDEKHPENVIRLLQEFKETKTVNEQHLPEILEILKQEQMSIPQLGRFFRVLSLVFVGNHQMYKSLQLRLGETSKMIPKLFQGLLKYRHGQINPLKFEWGALEYLVFLKNEDQVMEKYRNELANELLSGGVLSENEIARHGRNLPNDTKKDIVDGMLYRIFKSLAEARTPQHDPDTRDKLIKYFIYLLAFKNDDRMLYRLFLAPEHEPEKSSSHQITGYRGLSSQVSIFVEKGSWWNRKGGLGSFKRVLQILENEIHRDEMYLVEHQSSGRQALLYIRFCFNKADTYRCFPC
ncbi:uncharacterized protein MELLADRAFT_111835 [Melampsora larici-populina 98AG31]|uniref:Secreted protein n=1 Tax=Melampsora larici-populina (strain 98AG31 / pathotype 3-4-7) TaxID=747676 RepID=F4S4I0_MELLP|nr:uncharacterized protein MELLADRAFT_111835 [Melampsora larici-populina 98AG31]EGG00464.1 hypothetical protein MELLADRAFT_111835 [Melampsora larici-populina 98AG31]